MRVPFVLATMLIGVAFAPKTYAEETPAVLADLQAPSKRWVKKEAGSTTDKTMHWVHFHKINSHDVLAVAAWKAARVTVNSSPVRQASIETFNHDGHACASTPNASQPIAEVVRHRLVAIRASNANLKMPLLIDALETTYIYEPEEGRAAAMAHGYVFQAGELMLFVQHTSRDVITSEVSADLAFDLVARHQANTTDVKKQWAFSISRDNP